MVAVPVDLFLLYGYLLHFFFDYYVPCLQTWFTFR